MTFYAYLLIPTFTRHDTETGSVDNIIQGWWESVSSLCSTQDMRTPEREETQREDNRERERERESQRERER